MIRIGISQAKARFYTLLKQAQGGEVIVITRRGAAVAELHPVRRVRFGALRGQIWIAPDFDEPLPDFKPCMP